MKVCEIVTSRIVEAMRSTNVIPWRKPWNVMALCNAFTKRAYRGINVMMLSLLGTDTEFVTFKQIVSKKGTLEKGSKSLPVVFHCFDKDQDGEQVYKGMRYYNVFPLNATNLESLGLERKAVKAIDFVPLDKAEAIASKAGFKVNVGGNRACYSLTTKEITMPQAENFHSREEYYQTLFHEIGHTTGDKLTPFRTEPNHKYSLEELVAEIFANFCMSYLNIETKQDNSIAYLQDWISALSNNPTWIEKASGQAQKRFEWLLIQTGEKVEVHGEEKSED